MCAQYSGKELTAFQAGSKMVSGQRAMSRIRQHGICGVYGQASSIGAEGQKGFTDEIINVAKDGNDAGFHLARRCAA